MTVGQAEGVRCRRAQPDRDLLNEHCLGDEFRDPRQQFVHAYGTTGLVGKFHPQVAVIVFIAGKAFCHEDGIISRLLAAIIWRFI